MNSQSVTQSDTLSSSKKHPLTEGVICGVGAGALWGLVFLAPALVHNFHPLLLAIGRYTCYGLISVCMLLPRRSRLAPLISVRQIANLNVLAILGNTLYYILLSAAVQNGGIAMTSLIIGFLPVAVTVVGSQDHGAVSLRKLIPSLICCALGVLCIGWQALMVPNSLKASSQLVGFLCALGALASWTVYAIKNARSLKEHEQITAQDWNLLTGIATGAQSLILIPVAILICRESHPLSQWYLFASISLAVAVFASIAGNALWNRMSQLLPLTLVGQMILFETIFALLYGLVWEHRLPTALETLSFMFVISSVVLCVRAHQYKH